MKYNWFFYLILIIPAFSGLKKQTHEFTFKKTQQGVEILENGQAVLFYQRESKTSKEAYICNNYIHPLYSLSGDTITEEFPADHPYHRGAFWAWHQIYVNGKSVGDGWTLTNIQQKVTDIDTIISNKSAQLRINALWKSPLFKNNKPFLTEETTITAYAKENTYRVVDFTIALKSLVPEVEIGGSDDEKGYGGFCVRISHPELLSFTSINGPVIPQKLQIKEGSWIDFSGPFGKSGEINGITLFCHPDTPNYPAPWILRAKTSMQNIVFPGKERITIPMDEPVKLHYRMIIHKGDAKSIDIVKLQSTYEQISLNNQ